MKRIFDEKRMVWVRTDGTGIITPEMKLEDDLFKIKVRNGELSGSEILNTSMTEPNIMSPSEAAARNCCDDCLEQRISSDGETVKRTFSCSDEACACPAGSTEPNMEWGGKFEYDVNKERTISEMALFWDEFAKHLPDSFERAALGDQKIFRAFRATYPKIKEYIETRAYTRAHEKGKAEERERIAGGVKEMENDATPVYSASGCDYSDHIDKESVLSLIHDNK